MSSAQRQTWPMPRAYPRYVMDQRLIIRAGIVFHGRTKDISEGGLGATVAGELQTDSPVELEFYLPGKLSPMKLMAEVRYRQGFQYGFSFVEVTPEQRFAIREATIQLALAP